MKNNLFWKICAIVFLVLMALWVMNCMKIFLLPNDWSWLKEWAAVISAVAAVLAILSAIFIHLQTKRMMKPTERPIFAIKDCIATSESNIEEGFVESHIRLLFRNAGKHTASDVRMFWIHALTDDLNVIGRAPDFYMANRVHMDTEGGSTLLLRAKLTDEEMQTQEFTRTFYLFFLIIYKDQFTKEKLWDDFWFHFKFGNNKPRAASIEEKEIFKSQIEIRYPDVKEYM